MLTLMARLITCSALADELGDDQQGSAAWPDAALRAKWIGDQDQPDRCEENVVVRGGGSRARVWC